MQPVRVSKAPVRNVCESGFTVFLFYFVPDWVSKVFLLHMALKYYIYCAVKSSSNVDYCFGDKRFG